MNILSYIQARFFSHRHECIAIGIIAMTAFIFIALYSYNPHDASWFYYQSNGAGTTNWSGPV